MSEARPAWRRFGILGLAAASAASAVVFALVATPPPAPVPMPTPSEGEPARPAVTFDPSLVPRSEAPAPSPMSNAHCLDLEAATRADRPRLAPEIDRRADEVLARLRRVVHDRGLDPVLVRGVARLLGSNRSAWWLAVNEMRAAPETWRHGFEVRTDAATWLASRTWRSDPRDARELAREAGQRWPDGVLPRLVEIAAADALDDPAEAARAASRAFALAPRDPLVAFEHFRRSRDGVDVDASLAALDAYLAVSPPDADLVRERALLRARRAALGDAVIRSRDGVSSAAAREVDDIHVVEALATVRAALDQAAALLGVPPRPTLGMIVYRDHDELVAVTCGPEWSGALFDGAIHVSWEQLRHHELADGTLRHEALHAAMDWGLAGGSRPPRWLGEGVAQYFAGGVTPAAEDTFAMLVREHTFVPLASLEGPFGDIEDGGDASIAYHQSLAMVLYLVERRGERGIASAIEHLREGGSRSTVLASIGAPLDGELLLRFLEERAARRARWSDEMASAVGAR